MALPWEKQTVMKGAGKPGPVLLIIGTLLGVALWWAVYSQLIPFSEAATALFPVDRHSHTGEAIAFFFYDVPSPDAVDPYRLCHGGCALMVQP